MTYMLSDINEAVDRKFLVTSRVSNQAEVGTVIHIMGMNDAQGEIAVYYRVTTTGQDFFVKFKSLKEFSRWARPDDFIARYYESFSKDEIKHYIKVNSRTFGGFCLPIIIVLLAAIWAVSLFVLKGLGTASYIIGGVLTLVAIVAILVIYKRSKSNAKMKLYRKVSTKWGISF